MILPVYPTNVIHLVPTGTFSPQIMLHVYMGIIKGKLFATRELTVHQQGFSGFDESL